jgi:hypothetical protein
MSFKINISTKVIVRFGLFLAIIGSAILLDVYLENHPAHLEIGEQKQEQQTAGNSTIYLIAQSYSTSLKTPVQKASWRNLQIHSHDKFIQKYHNIRNYQVLKAETAITTTPLIQSYHYLVFQQHFFPQPDEDPLA